MAVLRNRLRMLCSRECNDIDVGICHFYSYTVSLYSFLQVLTSYPTPRTDQFELEKSVPMFKE